MSQNVNKDNKRFIKLIKELYNDDGSTQEDGKVIQNMYVFIGDYLQATTCST